MLGLKIETDWISLFSYFWLHLSTIPSRCFPFKGRNSLSKIALREMSKLQVKIETEEDWRDLIDQSEEKLVGKLKK